MEFQGEYLIPAPLEEVWSRLHDEEVMKTCVEGCEEMTRVGDFEYRAKVRAKIGPVRARFSSTIRMLNVKEFRSYTLDVRATGGAAGFGNGQADISLIQEGEFTKLLYDVKGTVGGKLAQIGSRLIQSVTNKMTEEFFTKFVDHWTKTA